MTKTLHFLLMGIFLCCGRLSASTVQTDQSCLAIAVYYEAGHESLNSQIAVGEVIKNRVSAKFAPSICGVVKQHSGSHWQFGFNKDRKFSIPPKQRQYFYDIAHNILDEAPAVRLPPNVLYFNNHPFDKVRYILYAKIGHQYFFARKLHRG
jgi:hypothetical protein